MTTTMRKSVLAGLAVSILSVGLAGPAAAGPGSSISVRPKVVDAGGQVRISGSTPVSDCPADDAAILTSNADLFPPDGFGPVVPRDANGAFSVVYRVPATTPAATYQIGFRCGGGNVGVFASLRVR
jgi:hypothetical protein